MHPLLEIKNLQISFIQDAKSVYAVDDVSFKLFPGKLTALVGESGSGKSATALSILRLLPIQAHTEGSILFCNGEHEQVNIKVLLEKDIRLLRGNKISMIFQEPMTSLNPLMTCGQQVMETIQQHEKTGKREARKRTLDLFEKVELPNPATMLHRYPHEISGGQKQRVMIAMAICCNPSLLIADEPSTALDVRVQQHILSLIKKLQSERKMAVLLITHDLSVVSDTADDIIVMYKGKIAEQGPAADIIHNPQHPYTKALLQCRPKASDKGKRLLLLNSEGMPLSQENANKKITAEPAITQHTLPLLNVTGLTVNFPTAKNFFGKPTAYINAVNNVSFTVMKGETVGLVGESGCGKTTLGRAILQLIQPSAGKITLDGTNLTALSASELRKCRKDLQIVFQDPYGSLNPRMCIGDAIVEALQVHRIYDTSQHRKEMAVAMLQKVQLDADHYKRYPHQFSGGQRQRICIARALALNPAFLIFDESVSALDVRVQAGILNLISDLKYEMGFTSLFISHDLSVIHYISDRILVMQKGCIIEEGNADNIYNRPVMDYTKKLIASIPGKRSFMQRN